MPSKFKIDNFEPQKISHAKDILDKYLRQAKRFNQKEEVMPPMQKKKISLWHRFLHFFKR